MLSRRAFLTSTAALAIVPALPAVLSAAPTVAVTKPATTIWVAGHAGDFDWHPFHAETRLDALRQALYHHRFGTGDDMDELLALPEPELAKRLDSASFGLDRVPSMDGLQPAEIKPYHWIDAGMGAFCDRCDSECYGGDGGRVFGTEVVCEECTTIPDLLGADDDDVEIAEERLTEWFLGHDCDEQSVRRQMSKDSDPDLISPHIWQKCLAEARTA
jgi:hypothetical protein